MSRQTAQDIGSTVDPAEVAHFDAMAATWWDPRGKMRALHMINPVRIGYIRDAACRHFDRDRKRLDCLKDLGNRGACDQEPGAAADVEDAQVLKAIEALAI